MEKTRKTNKIIVVLLLILLAGLSIGFAAFEKDLTIKSGASVTPDPEGFAVVFSSSKTASSAGSVVTDGTYAQEATFDANTTTLTDLKANFTEPGQTATWTFYSFNAGMYDAFLNDVTLGAITCTAKLGTDQSKVDAAAEGIHVKVSVNETEFTTSNNAINNHLLKKGEGEEVTVTLSYDAGSAIADGNFDVTVGDIILGYDSIDVGVTSE